MVTLSPQHEEDIYRDLWNLIQIQSANAVMDMLQPMVEHVDGRFRVLYISPDDPERCQISGTGETLYRATLDFYNSFVNKKL